MEEKEILNTLAGLRALRSQAEAELKKWQLKVEGLNSSIDLCESMLPTKALRFQQTHIFSNHSENEREFPLNKSSKEQIIYLLNRFGRITRMPELQEEFNKYVPEVGILHACRRLKDEGILVTARFNDNWKQVYYGLSEWIEEDKNGAKNFKSQYRPTEEEMPFGYDTIDFDYK